MKDDSEILDLIVECYQDIYKEPELGKIIHDFAVRRKQQNLAVDGKYIKWLYNRISNQEG